jgi:hypothetical protein
VGLTHGRFAYQLLRPENGQLFFGPLDDALRGNDVHAPFYRESSYCAPCHEGTIFGVHAYGTYSEWLESPARREGKSCQSCHMAPTGKLSNIAPGHGGIERDPTTLASHSLFAGSQAEMLRKSLQVEVKCEHDGDAFRIAVTVTAKNVGHRIPTGFPDRNLILLVEGFDAKGRRVMPHRKLFNLSDLAGQEWKGLQGTIFAKKFINLGRQQEGLFPFWRAGGSLIDDSRLNPEEPNTNYYRFEWDLDHIRVRLVYRRFWESVRLAKGWPNDEITVVDKTSRAR